MDSLIILSVGLGVVGVLICFVGSFVVLTYYADKEGNAKPNKRRVEESR